jgi:hypothetical protein
MPSLLATAAGVSHHGPPSIVTIITVIMKKTRWQVKIKAHN